MQLDAIHLLNGPRRRLNIPHRNETKATRATSTCIVYDHNLVDIADASKLVLSITLGRADAQSKHTNDMGRGWRRARRRRVTTAGRRRSRVSVVVRISRSTAVVACTVTLASIAAIKVVVFRILPLTLSGRIHRLSCC